MQAAFAHSDSQASHFSEDPEICLKAQIYSRPSVSGGKFSKMSTSAQCSAYASQFALPEQVKYGSVNVQQVAGAQALCYAMDFSLLVCASSVAHNSSKSSGGGGTAASS